MVKDYVVKTGSGPNAFFITGVAPGENDRYLGHAEKKVINSFLFSLKSNFL